MSSTEEKKLEAFTDPDIHSVAGFKLKPVTAQSLHFLKHTKSGLLRSALDSEDPDFFYHIASFIYLHTETVETIKDLLQDPEEYRDRIVDLLGKIRVKDLIDAAGKIRILLEKSAVGDDYEILQEDGDQNSNAPN